VIEQSFSRINEAEARLNTTLGVEGYDRIRVRNPCARWSADFEDAKPFLEAFKRDVWRVIVDRLEIRRAMSIAASKALDDQLEKGELPDVSEGAVHAFVASSFGRLEELSREAVVEVFELLRPRCSKLKTNTQFEIGRRVVLHSMVERQWNGKGFRLNHYRRTADLRALENVFSMLAGDGVINDRHRSELEDAIVVAPDGRGETRYFKFRACINGNLHLEFKRRDLVGRLNRIAGGMRLKSAE